MVEGLLEADQEFLVGVRVSGHPGTRKVAIQIDSDAGLNINRCSQVSRQLSKMLDERDVLDGAYALEVSSPGLDQPLLLPRQYKKNIGRMVKIVTNDKSIFSGKLAGADDAQVVLEIEQGKGKNKTGKVITFKMEEILNTTVLVAF
jgi:ribosome maturation factor RimP